MPRRKTNRKGGDFWSSFKKGFALPFKGIGELGSAALGGLLGDGRPKVKGGMGNMAKHRMEDARMKPNRNGRGYNGEDYVAKYRHVNGFPTDFHREYVAKYMPYANSPAIGIVRY